MTQIVNAILGITGVVAFVWNMVGILPGIILVILALTTKDKEKKKKYFKWVKICFGGVALLIVVFVLYFLFSFLGALLGFSVSTSIPR
jgi:amino acid transporter